MSKRVKKDVQGASRSELHHVATIPFYLVPEFGDRGMVECLTGDEIESDDLRASIDFHGGSLILDKHDQTRVTEVGWEVWKFLRTN